MKTPTRLSQADQAKIWILRASLWSQVYQATALCNAHIAPGAPAIPADPAYQADLAVTRFDLRFQPAPTATPTPANPLTGVSETVQ